MLIFSDFWLAFNKAGSESVTLERKSRMKRIRLHNTAVYYRRFHFVISVEAPLVTSAPFQTDLWHRYIDRGGLDRNNETLNIPYWSWAGDGSVDPLCKNGELPL